MKKLIFYFIVLLISVWIGVLLHRHQGYVLISYGHTTIEMTLWLAILAIIIAVFLLYGLIRLLRSIFHIPEHYHHWQERRCQKKSQKLALQGLYALMAGYWRKAENLLVKATQKTKSAVPSYLGAAKAAQWQKEYGKRNEYLDQARKQVDKSHRPCIDMLKARWQIQSEEWEAARATVTDLERSSPQHPLVLRELAEVYQALHEWQRLLELLPRLRRYQALSSEQQEDLELKVYKALLLQNHGSDLAMVEKIWKKIPTALQKEPALLAIYVSVLHEHHQDDKAENLLKTALRTQLDRRLLHYYAEVVSANPSRQLARAEAWLQENPDDPDLLFCLGKLCIRHKLWGKARSYLEAVMAKEPRPEVSLALGEALEQLREPETALLRYREGLGLCANI